MIPLNEDNLIPFEERTEEELREMRRKGGINSGKARREKKLFKEAIEKKLHKNIQKRVRNHALRLRFG